MRLDQKCSVSVTSIYLLCVERPSWSDISLTSQNWPRQRFGNWSCGSCQETRRLQVCINSHYHRGLSLEKVYCLASVLTVLAGQSKLKYQISKKFLFTPRLKAL